MRWLYDTPEGPRDATPQEIANHDALMYQSRGCRCGAPDCALLWVARPAVREIKHELGGAND